MRKYRARLAKMVLVCTTLSGCAGLWDEVTSREFSMRSMVNPPDPMTVLRSSNDGDARAKAMRRLTEPARSGQPGQQDEVVKLLTDAALGDPQPICRMAAIQTLGKFQDPRAIPALVNAYESAEQLTPDAAFIVRCQALSALGETKQPAAAEYLAKVATQPGRNDVTALERGHQRDVRLAAVRSLRNFPNAKVAADATAQLAQSERDVAVRDRAREAYVALTGNNPKDTASPTPTDGYLIQPVKHEQPGNSR